ncbi:peptide ABC transporter ATP-binding protein [Bifidobacterium ramosum]|uniref:ATP-binding cassette domain-containing protein n=1 Tax=Bifidobacterium ramosum TaxID=1798158 RepID=A0A6L4X131_9BIFI|nr:ABC transporter ATP-binding protein [Bifidobacterium ramosum]KAB8288282.1 peptide ABC transporter ATP-binding protein [Bifidobacterium ramosum]NEG71680.1 ATP-binding cassette domain-containing protein [Bifidobacterium ramosum]
MSEITEDSGNVVETGGIASGAAASGTAASAGGDERPVRVSVRDLHVTFRKDNLDVHAVRGVSFDLRAGETLALVGESGSGKSVTCRSLMRLLPRNARLDGDVRFDGRDVLALDRKALRDLRGNRIAMIFQDPMTSLDPTMIIGRQITETIRLHTSVGRREARERAIRLLDQVGISDAARRFHQYPHEFSGGQRQRIVIAIALACHPDVLIADEPTTALDVTMQAQILDLLADIQRDTGTAIILVTHDLGVVAKAADRVAVMYAGRIVEYGTADEIFYNPRHPYTWGLLGSTPTLDTERGRLRPIPGVPPNLAAIPAGDAFAPRNAYALAVDERYEPPFFAVSPTHAAATWLLDPRAPQVEPPAEIRWRWRIWHELQHLEGAA